MRNRSHNSIDFAEGTRECYYSTKQYSEASAPSATVHPTLGFCKGGSMGSSQWRTDYFWANGNNKKGPYIEKKPSKIL